MMRSNRFTGQTEGAALTAGNSSNSGTMTFYNGASATITYTATNAVYGMALKFVTTTAWGPAVSTSPTGQTSARGHFLLRVPAAMPTADVDLLGVGIGATGSYGITLRSTGAVTLCDGAASTTIVAAGSLPAAGTIIRVAWAVNLTAAGTGSTLKATIYTGDTTTVLGTAVTRTITTTANANVGDINLITGGAAGYTLTVPAVRAEWGPGCIDAHLLPEASYTPSTTPVIDRVASLTAGSVSTAVALTNLTDGKTSTAVTATVIRAAITPVTLQGGGLRLTLAGLAAGGGATTLTAILVDTTTGQTVSTTSASLPGTATDTTLTWPQTDLSALTTAQLESLECQVTAA